jgi:hypothetical protein
MGWTAYGRCESFGRRCQRVASLMVLLLGGVGCATVVTAPDHQVYSDPKYGADKFVQARGYAMHYVEDGVGHPVVLVPGAFTTDRRAL